MHHARVRVYVHVRVVLLSALAPAASFADARQCQSIACTQCLRARLRRSPPHLPRCCRTVAGQAINRHTEEEMQYTGVADAVRRMLADEGLAGFYKGMRVKLLQTVLAAALLMMLKEEIFAAVRRALRPSLAAPPRA